MSSIEIGSLKSQTYKGSKVIGVNVVLIGNELIKQDNKVTRFSGDINNSSNERIGHFEYVNVNEGKGMMNEYRSSVIISNSEYKELQIEAVTELLSGVSEIEKL